MPLISKQTSVTKLGKHSSSYKLYKLFFFHLHARCETLLPPSLQTCDLFRCHHWFSFTPSGATTVPCLD
ncbi:hypothetical protein S245_049742, partial [Arachis hypogaea]